MDHRTYGDTKDCKGCRYWSEMIAMSNGPAVQAMCLAPGDAPKRVKYTFGRDTCIAWKSGFDGAVDDPGSDPDRYESIT